MPDARIDYWCSKVIRIGFYLLFGIVPLLLTPWNYELFEYNKMIAVYGLTTIIIGSWLIKSIAQKEFRIPKTPLDIPILLFFASQLVSSLLSIDPHVSWFGYYSRFNGGMWSVICYILLYYAFASTIDKSEIVKFLKTSLITATIVAFYGVLERLGIDKHLWVQDVQNRVFSTLGQPNWLAAYLVALSPIAWGLALKSQFLNLKSKNKLSLGFVIWSLVSALFFLVLLFTRSRSGILAIGIADLVFWAMLYWKTASKITLRLPFVILHVAFGIILFLNGTGNERLDRFITYQGIATQFTQSASNELPVATPSAYTAPLLETGGTESGTIRKYVWEGAINTWNSSIKAKLIGTGTETFAFAFYKYRPVGHNMTSEWDFLYNKAHNEYLNYLATTGVFGLGSYLLFIGVFVWWFTKIQTSKLKVQNNSEIHIVNSALFAGWISILVTNFFGFSVVITQLFLFLFPAVYFSINQLGEARTFPLRKGLQTTRWFSLVVLIAMLSLLFVLYRIWYADTLFASGYRYARAQNPIESERLLTQAIRYNPIEPLYHDELGTALAALTLQAYEAGDATRAAILAKDSLAQNDIAIQNAPENVNYWKSRTKIFYAFSSFSEDFLEAAILSLKRASDLSPNDPKILYNQAVLLGRAGDNAQAIEILKKTIELKPNYRDAYWALSIFYTENKQPALATAIVQEYLTKVDPNDVEFQARLAQ